MTDRIGEAELNAYVDGQLDAAGRIEVEEHLARHPDLAARVMSDLSVRDALRLAFPLDTAPAPAQTRAWARRLETALRSGGRYRALTRLAAAVAIFALGWSASLGWSELRRTPDQAPLLAAAAQLGTDMNVRLPRLPDGWKMLNVSRTETPTGPAVQLTLQTPEFGRLSLVARHTRDVDFVLPTVRPGEKGQTAHWQMISDSYDLTAPLGKKPLEFAALELFQTLY